MKDIGYVPEPEEMAAGIDMLLLGSENAPAHNVEMEQSYIWYAVECTPRGLDYLTELEKELRSVGYNARYDTCGEIWAFGVYNEDMDPLLYVDSTGAGVDWGLFEE